jgi:putative endonuclease
MSNKSIGYKGEDLALNFLKNKGYYLLYKNFTIPGGEIDLIMKKNEKYVFVEVKTRRNNFFGNPEDSITKNKLKFLKRSIEKYFLKINASIYNVDFRLDLLTVVINKEGKIIINHYKNAFCFDDF